MKTSRQLIAAAALCVLGAAPAFAQGTTTFANGNFNTGLSGWETLGDVSVTGGSAKRAVMTTAALDGDLLFGDELLNLSGTSAAYIDDVVSFAQVAPAALDLTGLAYEGSVLKQSFNVHAGDRIDLNFWFGLVTQETTPADFNDVAFVAVNGAVQKVISLTDTNRVGQFSYEFLTGGLAQLSFGVVDINDTAGVSYFLVDDISVTAVPEPESYAMLLAGLAAVAGFARRRKA